MFDVSFQTAGSSENTLATWLLPNPNVAATATPTVDGWSGATWLARAAEGAALEVAEEKTRVEAARRVAVEQVRDAEAGAAAAKARPTDSEPEAWRAIVEEAYWLAFSRQATDTEIKLGTELMAQEEQTTHTRSV